MRTKELTMGDQKQSSTVPATRGTAKSEKTELLYTEDQIRAAFLTHFEGQGEFWFGRADMQPDQTQSDAERECNLFIKTLQIAKEETK